MVLAEGRRRPTLWSWETGMNRATSKSRVGIGQKCHAPNHADPAIMNFPCSTQITPLITFMRLSEITFPPSCKEGERDSSARGQLIHTLWITPFKLPNPPKPSTLRCGGLDA